MSERKVFVIKFTHTLIFFFMCSCLAYILYCSLTATFDWVLVIAIGTIMLEGMALLSNGWRCPLTIMAEKYGVVKGGVTDLFLPECISRNTFKVSTVLFICELIVLGVRYYFAI
jgi:hypothetical protein